MKDFDTIKRVQMFMSDTILSMFRCQLLEQERVPARLGGGLLKLRVQRGEALVFGVEKRVLLCRA